MMKESGPYALTPNTVQLIPTLGTLSPPRRARPGPGRHTRSKVAGFVPQTQNVNF